MYAKCFVGGGGGGVWPNDHIGCHAIGGTLLMPYSPLNFDDTSRIGIINIGIVVHNICENTRD